MVAGSLPRMSLICFGKLFKSETTAKVNECGIFGSPFCAVEWEDEL